MLFMKIILIGLFINIAYSDGSTECLNGGVQDTTGCKCLPYWQGDQCEQILCNNGGYTNKQNQYCICPNGYFGLHCEAATQTKPSSNMFKLKGNSLNLMYYNLFSDYYGANAYNIFTEAVNNHIQLHSQDYQEVNVNEIADPTYPKDCKHQDNTCDYGSQPFMKINPNHDVEKFNFPKPEYPNSYWCYYVPIYEYVLNMITDRGLEDTAITILTQHPPLPDDDRLNQLIQTALGFRIRINILFSDDQTFVRCTSDQINTLRQLSSRTGGIFTDVPADSMYNATNTIINTVLMTSMYYDAVDVVVGVDDLTFTTDPLLNDYYVLLSNGNLRDSTSCTGLSNGPSSKEFSVFQLLNAAVHPCALKFYKTSDAEIIVKIFVAGNQKGFRSFFSFVEDTVVDTSNIMPYNEVQYNVALRLKLDSLQIEKLDVVQAFFVNQQSPEGNVTIASDKSDILQRQDYSLDNFIKKPFSCLTTRPDDIFGIRLTIQPTLNKAVSPFMIKRYFPVHCMSNPQPTKLEAVVRTAVVSAEESTKTGSVLETTPTTSVPPKKTFVLGYTNTVDDASYETFLLASTDKNTGSLTNHYSDFGEVLFQDKKMKGYVSQTDYDSFIQAVYNDQKKNPSNAYSARSQIIDALKSIIEPTDPNQPVNQNALISFLTDVLPEEKAPFSDSDLASYKDFINKNSKILFWIDNSDFESQVTAFSRSADLLNVLAAMSNGHMIISNHSSPDFSNLLTDFYSKGPAQNLIFSKNFNNGGSQVLGSIDLSSMKNNVSIYATATVFIQKSSDIHSRPLSLQITSQKNTSIPLMLNYMANSNLYTLDFQLSPDKYTISALFLDGNTRVASLRFWSADLMFTDFDLTYNDYDETPILAGPNTYSGAALRAQMYGNQTNKLCVTYSDCRSRVLQTSYFDAQQCVDNINDIFHFVPLFCQKRPVTDKCVAGTERVYNLQISTDDGTFIGTKSLYCDDSSEAPVCSTVDENGNYFCDTPKAPFLRGPARKLLDCSENGKLIWVTEAPLPTVAHYKCSCQSNTEGQSCERGICDDAPQPGALDVQVRTYTAVIGFLSDNTLTKMVFADALPVLKVDTATTNIWLYQLIIYCSNGNYYPVYIGKDPQEFNKALEQPDDKITCSITSTDTDILDLSDIFRVSTTSLGKEQNGVVAFYYESSTPLKNITVNSEQFYENSQQYRQKLFVYNACEDSTNGIDVDSKQDVIQATLATGGNTIVDNLLLDSGNEPSILLFQTLIKSKSISLNYHNFKKNAISTFKAGIENNNAYVIVGGSASQASSINGGTDRYNIFTTIIKISSSVTFSTTNPASWASVIVLDGAAMPYAILKDRAASDSWTAVSVNQPDTRPTLGIKTPDGYNINNSLYPHSRIASRKNCVFDTVLYQPIAPLSLGYSQYEITLVSADGKLTINKVFPIVTSASSACKNNIIDQSKGVCQCQGSFTGPDCSKPVCGDHGFLSTWGTACNCDGTIGGRFCNDQANGFFYYF